jgi:transcriptional regulator
MTTNSKPSTMVQGTLDMLVLKTLTLEPMHAYGVMTRLKQITRGGLQVHAGSLFPALRRLERDGLIRGTWRETENHRRARFYALSAAGRRALERYTTEWEQQTQAIARVLRIARGQS